MEIDNQVNMNVNNLTNIEMVRQESQQNTNIITMKEIKQTLMAHPEFDWEEFNKPYNEVDFVKCANSLDFEKISSQWTQKSFKGAATKSAFTNYEMKTGHIFTIGSTCNQKNNLMLLTDVQSQFCSHNYTFGDDNQKKLLTTDIAEILKAELPDIRKLSKVSVNFMISSSSQNLQSTETMEQLKYISLMHEVATIKIGNTHDPKHQTPQYIGEGFIKHSFDEKKQEDVVKMQLNTQLLKTQSWSDPVQIINIQNPDNLYDESQGIKVEKINDQFKNITSMMRVLQNKNLDIVVQFDGASVKKDGKKLLIKPKMNIVQIIVKGVVQQQSKTFGLNLSKWIN